MTVFPDPADLLGRSFKYDFLWRLPSLVSNTPSSKVRYDKVELQACLGSKEARARGESYLDKVTAEVTVSFPTGGIKARVNLFRIPIMIGMGDTCFQSEQERREETDGGYFLVGGVHDHLQRLYDVETPICNLQRFKRKAHHHFHVCPFTASTRPMMTKSVTDAI
jgi:hypothetical protein